jgi:hypothetical protein
MIEGRHQGQICCFVKETTEAKTTRTKKCTGFESRTASRPKLFVSANFICFGDESEGINVRVLKDRNPRIPSDYPSEFNFFSFPLNYVLQR